MRYLLIVINTLGLFLMNLSVVIAEEQEESPSFSEVRQVDLSKAYVISNVPCLTDTGQALQDSAPCKNQLRLGGVISYNSDVSLMHWIQIDFIPTPQAHFNVITESGGLQSSEREWFEQRIRDTQWTGTYTSGKKKDYITDLDFELVQNGFVGGEITHRTDDNLSLLHVKVTGYLITQYCLVDEKGSCALGWIDLAEGESLPNNAVSRQQIILKRSRAIEHKHLTGQWGSLSEYRLALEINTLTGKEELVGNVGNIADSYSSGNAFTAHGSMSLEEKSTEPAPLQPTTLE